MSDRDRLAVLLAGASEPAAFSATRTAPAGDLQLEVRGVGTVKLPVSQAQAKQLCLVARPARYGRAEETLLDRKVRDTWEVPKSRVKIDKRRWDQTFVPVLDRLGRELGLPAGCRFRAELHSMLVYGPGQFFVEHQDSEKDDAMVATLVVGLPSIFKGGVLEVRHGGKTATYRGSRHALSFVAFFSDCRHQVKPVRSGYRVALTYNLLVRGEPGVSDVDADPELVGGLGRCLADHFAAGGPDRLVYLLDHEYTRRGLDSSRLKGADARSVALLNAAAKHAGCDAVLALADVHETWTAYDADERDGWYRGSRYGRRRYWDDSDGDDDEEFDAGKGAGEYDVEDLIESEITLDSWIDAGSGRLEQVGLPVGGDEVCASKPSAELEPYRSEYEGYMGNWGNTLDRWYHRGAVVIWPRGRGFAVRAEASPSWALDEVAARARRAELAGAREAAAELAPFWDRAVARIGTAGSFTKALRTARLLEESALAEMLLRPFRQELLTTGTVRALSQLVEAYGEPWARELVATWSAKRRGYHTEGPSPEAWMSSLPDLCRALRKGGDAGAATAGLLLAESWAWLSEAIERALALPAPSRREQTLAELGRPVGAVLDGASVVEAADVRDDAVRLLCRDADLLACAIATLRATAASRWSAVGLEPLATHCSAALAAQLARPARLADDWSIDLPPGCSCELCTELGAFLSQPTRVTLEWPLAEQRRRHVHGRIDTAELPVRHQTRRSGRPYTLVLTKTRALFEREAQQRRRDREDLAWLQQTEPRRAQKRT